MLFPRPHRAALAAAGCALALSTFATPALGRGPADRLQLVLAIGSVQDGPGGGIAKEFGRAGYNDDVPPFCLLVVCLPGRSEPREIGSRGSWSLSARYRLTPRLSLLAGFSDSELGGGEGFREGTGSSPDELVASEWGGDLYWLGALWTPRPWLHLGGGPGYYRVESGNEASGSRLDRPGLTAEAGLRTPSRWGFFMDFTTRYHWIRSQEVAYQTRQAPVVLHPKWSHLEIALGIGLGRRSP